ncbi:MAG: ATP synthase F1 subunit gamma [bacterium]
MTTARDVKSRIDSVENVRTITRTMKAVASAKLSKAKDRIERTRPYGNTIEETIKHVLARHPDLKHSYFYRSEDGNEEQDDSDKFSLYLLLTADRGLCGSFNSNILSRAEEIIEREDDPRFYVIGKRGVSYAGNNFSSRVIENKQNIWDDLDYGVATRLTHELVDEFELSDASSVTIVFNEFESAMVQNVVEYPLLPLDREDFYNLDDQDGSSQQVDFKYEPDPDSVINRLFPRHVRTQVYVSMLESFASEQGARMVAMDNATENANEMIEDLTLEYNQLRQATITKEIAEIVGGAEALKG